MKSFWLIWSPDGETPPRVIYKTQKEAERIAASMARKVGLGSVFFVMKAESAFQCQAAGIVKFEP